MSGESLALPTGVAVSGSGASATIYTADANSCVVWQSQNGQTSILAGQLGMCSGSLGSSPTSSSLAYPVSLALCNGNLFIATHGVDNSLSGLLFQNPTVGGQVFEISSAGVFTQLPAPGGVPGAGPLFPVAIACDKPGNVYVSSYYYLAQDSGFFSEIEKLAPSGSTWTSTNLVSDALDQAYPALAVDSSSGDLFAILAGQVGEGWLGTPLLGASSIQNITKGTAGISANNVFFNASGVALQSSGNFLVSQATGPGAYTSHLDEVTSAGATTVVAGTGTPGYSGDGGPATSAEINGVDGIAVDSGGYIYLADSENQRIRRIHNLTPGPSALQTSSANVPQNSGTQFGSLQGVLNPLTGDFYYVAGANGVNVINTGSAYLIPGYERIFASIAVGAPGKPGYSSPLTLALDSTRNLVYVSNAADGNLYVVDGSTWALAGKLALDSPGASLLAVDTGLNEIYAAGPTTNTVSAIRGGTTPILIGNLTGLDDPISSISVDANTHVVYAVGEGTEGSGSYLEALYTFTPALISGELSQNTVQFPEFETIVQPNFLTNSIAADTQSGSLLTAGIASIDILSPQTYDSEDLFQLPELSYAPVPYSWPPITLSLDVPNRAFYITDFEGNLLDPSSNATMVTGIDSVTLENNTLTSVTIPVFGSGPTPAAPHVYDSEPDTSSYQAWISGSDATDGGFVRLWDSTTQKVTLSTAIPNAGGGHLMVDSNNHGAYLLDHVNGLLWLINKPQWTPTPSPTFAQSTDGQSVTITASNNGDLIYYTLDGTPPGLSSTQTTCASPCNINLTTAASIVIGAMEYNDSTLLASNVVQDEFAAPAPTSIVITSLVPNPVTTGTSTGATATLTVASGVTSVAGTVTFSAVFNGKSSTLCSGVAVTLSDGSWQAPCSFTEDNAGTYIINAAFSGDSLNQMSTSSPVTLTVNQGTKPLLIPVSGETNPLAINPNPTPELPWNAVLNTDSSVSLVEKGSLVSGGGCPAFSNLKTNGISAGAVFVDAANTRIYLAMISGTALYAAYETLNQQGNCTQGPPLEIVSLAQSDVGMNVDVAQGYVYILNSFGVNPDSLYIVPTATWNPTSLPKAAQVTLDYSATYGPIVIDPSNHQVYIDDLGTSATVDAGTYSTSGFFVYDPTHSTTPASNLVWVAGYLPSGSNTPVPFNVGALLDNGSGSLALVNENTSYATTNDTVPLTLLDTTQFSFFQNTRSASNLNSSVDITPGAGLSTISASAKYGAIGAADINTATGLVYAYAYFSSSTQPGMLLEYNLNPSTSWPAGQTTAETVLSSSIAQPTAYDYGGPWTQLNYDLESTQIALWAGQGTNGSVTAALGVVSPLCSGNPSLTQLLGAEGSPTPLDAPVVNVTSGYVYAIQPGVGYPPTSSVLESVSPAPNSCSGSTAPVAIAATSGGGQSAVIGQAFASPLVVNVTDASHDPVSGAMVTFSVPASGASASLSATTATTGSDGTATVTATANGIASSTPYTVSAAVAGVTTPAVFALTNAQATTKLTVAPSALSLVYGQPVTVDVAISPSNVDGTMPSGSVAFYDGTTKLAPSEAVLPGATASDAISAPTVGSHTYSAQYLGDSNFLGSALTAAASAVVVGKATSALTGPATQPVSLPSVQGGTIAVTVTGEFSGNGIAKPSGNMIYSVKGNASLSGSTGIIAGTATIVVPACTTPGDYTLTVNYAGDENYTAAAAITIQLTVTSTSTGVTQFAFQTAPPTTLTAGGNPGTVVVLEENSQGATVTTASDKLELDVSSVPAPFSTGSSAGVFTNRFPVTAADGVATFSLSSDQLIGAGIYTFIAEAPMCVSYATATETVTPAAPAAVVIEGIGNNRSAQIGEDFQSPLNVSVFDQYGNLVPGTVVTYTAPTTTGPSAVLSSPTATVSATTSFASVNATADGYVGKYTVTATVGMASGAPSAGFSMTNQQAMTQMTFAIAPQTPIIYGQQATTLTATLTPAGGSVPTGTVSFKVYGTTTIGSAAVNSSGVAQGAFYLTPDEELITASYSGDNNYAAIAQTKNVNFVSFATPTLSGPTTVPIVTLPGAGTTVPIQVIAPYSGPGIALPSGNLTYTLTQIGSTTQPEFGTVPLNSSAAATITIPSTLAAGSWNLSVSYSGDMNYAYGASLMVPVDVADFSLSTSSGSIANVVANPGQTASWTFTIAPVAPATTFPFNINLSVSGLPAGATYTINPSTIQGGSGSTTVTLTVTLPAPAQAHNRQSPAGPLYAVLAVVLLPFARRIRDASGRVRRLVLLLAIASAVFAASAGLNGCGSGGFFNQPPENYTIKVTGTAGSVSHSLDLGLTVE